MSEWLINGGRVLKVISGPPFPVPTALEMANIRDIYYGETRRGSEKWYTHEYVMPFIPYLIDEGILEEA